MKTGGSSSVAGALFPGPGGCGSGREARAGAIPAVSIPTLNRLIALLRCGATATQMEKMIYDTRD